jgi:hypothetical protein
MAGSLSQKLPNSKSAGTSLVSTRSSRTASTPRRSDLTWSRCQASEPMDPPSFLSADSKNVKASSTCYAPSSRCSRRGPTPVCSSLARTVRAKATSTRLWPRSSVCGMCGFWVRSLDSTWPAAMPARNPASAFGTGGDGSSRLAAAAQADGSAGGSLSAASPLMSRAGADAANPAGLDRRLPRGAWRTRRHGQRVVMGLMLEEVRFRHADLVVMATAQRPGGRPTLPQVYRRVMIGDVARNRAIRVWASGERREDRQAGAAGCAA